MPGTVLDSKLLEILVCPENLSPLRLADEDELRQLNERLAGEGAQCRDGIPAAGPVDALLIREDGKVGYEIRDGFPRLLVEAGIVLDNTVGAPDPAKYR